MCAGGVAPLPTKDQLDVILARLWLGQGNTIECLNKMP
jgi:hypothetical protein